MVIAGLIILGLCLGSFVNALVYRLHWHETHPKAPKDEKRKHSIGKGRSICPNCKHVLAAKDLIPVLSWVSLSGRCRYCHKHIPVQYALVEASTALLFAFSYIFWPYSLQPAGNAAAFALWLVFLTGFIALCLYDIKYLTLPNKIIFPLAIMALGLIAASSLFAADAGIIKEAAAGFLIGGGLFYGLFQISNGAWIGGGDVKLGFLLGALIGGPWPAVLMLFLASLLGTIYSAPMIVAKKMQPKSRIPFGPFLIVAAIIVQFFGSDIIDWYTTLAGSGY